MCADRVFTQTQALLNALEGVCYVADFDGAIKAIGTTNWKAAADDGGASYLSADAVIGTNLFEHISGEQVVAFYRHHFGELAAGRRAVVSFVYRCDTPDMKREMRMCLSCVKDGERAAGVLCQSVLVNATSRPRINLFDVELMERVYAEERDLPMITMCSYCHRIKMGETHDTWRTPEEYYRSGGNERVRISHGMCLDCYKSLEMT